MLSHQEARKFYDRFGSKVDSQAFYEDPATSELLARGDFDRARAVFEFGCGTGRFAERLLARHLPPGSRYVAVDLSSTMIALAKQRLSHWGARAQVRLSDGSPKLDEPESGFDRFVSNYVLDLLSVDDIRVLLGEARRVLSPQGLLCLVSLTEGATVLSRAVTRVWKRVHAVRPSLVGGCRPLEMALFLTPSVWQVRHRRVVTAFGISSEVVVAAPLSR